MNQAWAWTIGLALFGSLTVVVIAGAILWNSLPAAGILAAVYMVLIVSWPFAAINIDQTQLTVPWPWYLCNLAMAAAALAFTRRTAVFYVLAVATAYALVRLTPPGGSAGLLRAILDSGYTVVLGLATVIVISLLRRSTTDVDRTQTAATVRYAAAVREHRFEIERLRVDALLHDSVLTTLLMAGAKGDTLDPKLAVAMATNSLSQIHVNQSASHNDTPPAPLAALRSRFEKAIDELGVDVTLTTCSLEQHAVPTDVIEDLFAATMQALVNSIQHAGPGTITRSITITWDNNTVTIVISDNGQGFDTTTPTERLGVRHSILERTRNTGGTATIISHPGHGTTITLTWPKPPEHEVEHGPSVS
jgi:signal transduction histidine kinase